MGFTMLHSYILIFVVLVISTFAAEGQCLLTGLTVRASPEAEVCDLFDPTADEIIENNALAASLGVEKIDDLQTDICENGDCNITLCFALDGSGSVSPVEFQVQKDLVKLLASLAATGNASHSATQYGLSNTFISSTTYNVTEFNMRVEASQRARDKRTFLGGGLAFCISQVNSQPERAGKKVVVLGDGRGNFANDALSLVLASAGDVEIYAVGVGFPMNSRRLREITRGRRDRVFNLRRYSDVGQVVTELSRALCNVNETDSTTA